MANIWSRFLEKLPSGRQKSEDLPDRSFELTLDLPRFKSQGKSRFSKKELAPRIEFWKSMEIHPVELLRDIDRYLKRVNSEPVLESDRTAWLEQALQFACPAMRRIYSEEYKVEAVPETPDRREGITAAANVCSQLSAGFKRQLLYDYSLPDSRYAAVRQQVRLTTLRILELTRMEQRLRSMRYQKLPGTAWRDCNRIFFAISQCEEINEVRPILPCLQPRLDSRAREQGKIQPQMTSIRHMYLVIQLYGLMDTNSVSSQNMHMIDAYLARVADRIEINPDDGSPLAPGEVIVYPDQKGPAFYQRQSSISTKSESADDAGKMAIKIDLVPLEMLLKREQKKLHALFEAEQEGEEKAVTNKEDLARLSIVDIMCARIRAKQRKEERRNVIGQEVLFVYNGFMQVYKYLVELSMKDDDEVSKDLVTDSALRDALAGRSALIASGVRSSEYGQWFILDKSEGGVHIKTEESRFTTEMFVGQILAFSYSKEELQKPIIGYVTRLSRSSIGEIEVTIQALSRYPVTTAVQSDFLKKNDMAFPAILLEKDDKQDSMRLILHHSHHLSPGTEIQAEMSEKQDKFRVDDISSLHREFIVYTISPLMVEDS